MSNDSFLTETKSPLAAPYINSLSPYVPGKPIEEVAREYGLRHIVKLASNENCLGASPKAVLAVQDSVRETHLYPDAGGVRLRQRVAAYHAAHHVQMDHVVLGNGTNELITLLVRTLLAENEAMLNAWPSFFCYRLAAQSQGRQEVAVPLTADLQYDLDGMLRAVAETEQKGTLVKLVFLANPNNPTGRLIDKAALARFVAALPAHTVVVFDEAYTEYVPPAEAFDAVACALSRPRTMVLRTFSKAFGLAALRVGYGIGDKNIVSLLQRVRDAFNTSSLAQNAAIAALDDIDHVKKSVEHNSKWLPVLDAALQKRGFSVTPSGANFVLAHVGTGMPSAMTIYQRLLERGVIVRPVGNYQLPNALRINVGTEAEMQQLFTALDAVLRPALPTQTQPLVVAIDGPAGAGKSTVAKLVAQDLGLSLVDTGAIYRSLALVSHRQNISWDDGEALAALATSIHISFVFRDGKNRVFLGEAETGEDISEAIRTPLISSGASQVSRHGPVRAAFLDVQRRLGRVLPGSVLEGRDIGTVIFPDAAVKIFLTASSEERARRRCAELAAKGQNSAYSEVLAEIRARDEADSTRSVAPLKPAADAWLLDTSELDHRAAADCICARVLAYAHKPSDAVLRTDAAHTASR